MRNRPAPAGKNANRANRSGICWGVPSLDFAALLDASPNNYMVLDRELRYVWANAAYLATTGPEWGSFTTVWTRFAGLVVAGFTAPLIAIVT